jgi:hypothetical protein
MAVRHHSDLSRSQLLLLTLNLGILIVSRLKHQRNQHKQKESSEHSSAAKKKEQA